MIVPSRQKDILQLVRFGNWFSQPRPRTRVPAQVCRLASRNSFGGFGAFPAAAIGSVSEKKKLLVSAHARMMVRQIVESYLYTPRQRVVSRETTTALVTTEFP